MAEVFKKDRIRTLTIVQPKIYPNCGAKEVRKALLGYPIEEGFIPEDLFLIGCIPDYPFFRNWGCINCDAVIFKDN